MQIMISIIYTITIKTCKIQPFVTTWPLWLMTRKCTNREFRLSTTWFQLLIIQKSQPNMCGWQSNNLLMHFLTVDHSGQVATGWLKWTSFLPTTWGEYQHVLVVIHVTCPSHESSVLKCSNPQSEAHVDAYITLRITI
jgi:hypothetical protein